VLSDWSFEILVSDMSLGIHDFSASLMLSHIQINEYRAHVILVSSDKMLCV
jgi:hypothetical protein